MEEEKIVTASGKPSKAILQFADDLGCDLIAMGTHDRNPLAMAVKGSVTNEVIRAAYVPVLALTPEKAPPDQSDQPPISTVLVPLDGSDFAEAALPYVEDLARRLNLEIVLVRVLDSLEVFPPIGGTAVPVGSTSPQMNTTPEDVAKDGAAVYLEEVAARLESQGLRARWEVITGDVAVGIASLARSIPHSMIALTSHSRSGVTRWVMGSVAEELLRGTGEPTLIIPAAVAQRVTSDS